jgi:hypothetical protein
MSVCIAPPLHALTSSPCHSRLPASFSVLFSVLLLSKPLSVCNMVWRARDVWLWTRGHEQARRQRGRDVSRASVSKEVITVRPLVRGVCISGVLRATHSSRPVRDINSTPSLPTLLGAFFLHCTSKIERWRRRGHRGYFLLTRVATAFAAVESAAAVCACFLLTCMEPVRAPSFIPTLLPYRQHAACMHQTTVSFWDYE